MPDICQFCRRQAPFDLHILVSSSKDPVVGVSSRLPHAARILIRP